MAFSVGALSATVTADDSSFNKTMKQVQKQGKNAARQVSSGFRNVGAQLMKTGAIMAASVTAPIVAGMNKMTNEAAVLEGAMAKFNVVFGDASDQMADWVREFRKEVPLATSEIVKHSAAMQDLLVPMGIARDEATGMSKDWLELAAALSAFNDVPVGEALDAIRSGISGMSRPLRQFGIDARETALQQTAIAEGLMKAGDQMSDQVRQQALLIKATEQSKDAIDGYADQQDSLLLIQQEVTASVKDLAASFGKILVPGAKRMGKQIASLVKRVTNLDDSTKRLALGVSSIAAGIPLAVLALGGLSTALGLLLSPISLTIAAIAGLIAIGKNVIDNWDVFAAELDHLWKGIVLSFQTGIKEVALAMNHIGLLSDDTFTEISKKTAEMSRQFQLAGVRAEMERENLVSLGETVTNLMGSIGELVQGWADWMFVTEQEPGDGLKAITEDVSILTNTLRQAAQATGDLARATSKYETIQDAMQETKEAAVSMGQALQSSVTDAIGSFAETLGNAFTGDAGAEGFFSNILLVVNEFANKFGKLLIAAGTAALAFKNLLANPVAAIIAGGALVTATTAVRSLLKKGPDGFRADGGPVSAGKSYVVGERGPELFQPGMSGRIIANDQMKSGGSNNIRKLEKAFSRSLRSELQRLGPEEIFVLSQKGKFAY